MRFGHESSDYRTQKIKKIWVKKLNTVATTLAPAPTIEQQKVVDAEGFQKAIKPIKLKPTSVPSTSTINAFEILVNAAEEVQDVVQNEVQEIIFGEHAVFMDIAVGGGNSSISNGYNIGL